MQEKEALQFVKILISRVRDESIRVMTNQLHAINLNAPTAKRWREARNESDFDRFGEMVIADTVDEVLFQFFNAIDEGILDISYTSENSSVNLMESEMAGEFGGWYMGEWRTELSNERAYED